MPTRLGATHFSRALRSGLIACDNLTAEGPAHGKKRKKELTGEPHHFVFIRRVHVVG